jgi:hypothetical protein
MNQQDIESIKSRIYEIREWISSRDTLGITPAEVVVLENKANDLEVQLQEWGDYLADMAHMSEYKPDYFYDGP